MVVGMCKASPVLGANEAVLILMLSWESQWLHLLFTDVLGIPRAGCHLCSGTPWLLLFLSHYGTPHPLPLAVPWAPHCHSPPPPRALGPVLPTLLYLVTWGPVPPTGFCTQLPQHPSLTLSSKGWEDRAQMPCPPLFCHCLLCLLCPPRCPPMPMPKTPPSSPYGPPSLPRWQLVHIGNREETHTGPEPTLSPSLDVVRLRL